MLNIYFTEPLIVTHTFPSHHPKVPNITAHEKGLSVGKDVIAPMILKVSKAWTATKWEKHMIGQQYHGWDPRYLS